MKNSKRVSNIVIKVLFTVFMLAMMCSATVYAAGNKTVNMKKVSSTSYQYVGRLADSKTTVYHKIYVPNNGLLLVGGSRTDATGRQFYNIRLKLYDSKKRLIEKSGGQVVNTVDKKNLAIYGVKKGYYYIQTSCMRYYTLITEFTAFNNTGVSAKSKAKNIASGKWYYGVMPAGESYTSADWIKFYVPSRKVLYLRLEAINNGNFNFYLYGPSYPNGFRIDSLKNKSGEYWSINARTRAKMRINSGYYYVKVIRPTSQKAASGVYALGWYLKNS